MKRNNVPAAVAVLMLRWANLTLGNVAACWCALAKPVLLGAALVGTSSLVAAQTISPLSFSFGNVPVTVTLTQTMTISTTSTMTITSLATSDARFTVTGSATSPCTVSLTLTSGQSCNFDVAFTPAGTGTYNNTTTIGYNDGAGSPFVLTQNSSGTGFNPPFTLTPASFNFGNVFIGNTPSTSFTFTNTSDTTAFPSTYTITGVATTGLWYSGIGSGGTPCANGLTLAPGTSCGYTVTVAPTSTGSSGGSTTIGFLAGLGTNPPYSAVFGLGVIGTAAPAVTLSATSLTYSGQTVGTSSASQTVTITNTGASTLNLTLPFTITGDFSVTTTCGATLAPAAQCTASVTFTPTVPGGRAGTLSIFSDAPGSPHQVTMGGTGQAPTATYSPPAGLDFGSVVQGSTSTSQQITFTNTSPGTLSLLSISFAAGNAGFAVVPSSLCLMAPTLGPGGSCTIDLTVTPPAIGTLTDSVFVVTSPANVATPATVPLKVTGVTSAPVFTPSATVFTFGTQITTTTSAAQILTITNTGNAIMSILGPSITGPFAISANSCTGLMPLSSCTMSITFTPTVDGAATGTLSIPTNAPGSPHVITLAGTGFVPPTITIVGAATVAAGASYNLALRLTSTSNSAIGGAAFAIAYPAGFTNNPPGAFPQAGCSTTIGTYVGGGSSVDASGGFLSGVATGSISCNMVIAQITAPATPGTYVFTLPAGAFSITSPIVYSNPSPVTLTVTVAPATSLTLSPTALAFGTRTVNTTSPASVVTLTNTGASSIFISGIASAGDFAFTSTCPLFSAPLAPAATCTISVTFTPLTAAALTGSITITSSDPASPQVISLTGTGAAVGVTNISVNPVSLDFGTLTVGTGSAPAGVVVSNTGFANLLLSGVAITGPFVRVAQPATPPDCGTSVAPGLACTISIAFTPAVTGSASGQLSITHNATGSPSVVSLVGFATPVPVPLLSVTPSVAFGDQILNVATTFNISLANSGSADLSVGSLTLLGSPDFALAGTCSVVPPGGACTVSLTFKPSGLGVRSARLDILSNSGMLQSGASVLTSLPISGNGILAPRPTAEVDVTVIGFGNSIFGGASTSQFVVLKSVGSSPLDVRNIFTTGPDFVQMNSCAGSLPTNATCKIAVSFVPLGLGAKTGELRMVTNALDSPHRVQLSGAGCRWFSQTASRFFLTTCGN